MLPGREVVEVSVDEVDESILISWDAEGNEFIIFRDILDHHSDDKAISNKYVFIHGPKQAPEKIKTTKGWYLLVEFIDGTNTWDQPADLN